MLFHDEIATFYQNLRKVSGARIYMICAEAHVSTRTYYKIMRHEPVKPECYEKLFIALSCTVSDEEFLMHWISFGKNLWELFNEEWIGR